MAKSPTAPRVQRPPAEIQFRAELDALAKADAGQPRPEGWKLTPRSVLSFILGDPSTGTPAKFVGSRALVETCVVSLATSRGLMLVGEPGTAKSWLSELLAAGISGDSTLTIQGSAGTTDDHIRYSWNYALLLAEGPSAKSLVPAPIYRGMRDGALVRFEEITRCPVEVQDTLLSLLSDRVLHVPEIPGDGRTLFARTGFNVIATANIRDRGVNEMSAALKRRFNFVTIPAIPDIREELAVIQREATRALSDCGIPQRLPEDLAQVLVTVFRELRQAQTADGQALEPMTTAMSTAEAVGVAITAVTHAWYFEQSAPSGAHLLHSLLGTAFKDVPEDRKRLAHYLQLAAKRHQERAWAQLFAAHATLG
jgi:MoxR-like ATPase